MKFWFLILVLLILHLSCKKETCTESSCDIRISRLKTSEKKDGYDIYDLNLSFNASKYGPKITPRFDVNSDGKIDFLFNSFLVQNSSMFSGSLTSSITPYHSDAFLFGYIRIDTLFNFTDTSIVDNSGKINVYSSYGTTCSSSGVNVISYSTFNAFRLPYLESYTTSFNGIWGSETVKFKNENVYTFTNKTETPDTTYFDINNKISSCWDMYSNKFYILFKVKKKAKDVFGFFEMEGPTTIKKVGIKK